MASNLSNSPKIQWVNRSLPPKVFPFADSFLVGTVPGCDLRLPNNGLPPLLFQISKNSNKSYRIKSFSPALELTLNNSSFTEANLSTGDKVQINDHEFIFSIPNEIQEPFQIPGIVAPKVKRKSKKKFLSWLVKKVKKKNIQLKSKEVKLNELETSLTQRDLEISARQSSFQSEKEFLEQQFVSMSEKAKSEKSELETEKEELQQKIEQLTKGKAQLDATQELRDSDLARLARFQDMLDRKFQHLRERAKEIDLRSGALQRTTRELENQAAELNLISQQVKLKDETTQILEKELLGKVTQVERKATELDSQISEILTLKAALEKNRHALVAKESELDRRDIDIVKAENALEEKKAEIRAEAGNINAEKHFLELEKQGFAKEQVLLLEEKAHFNAIRIGLEEKERALLSQASIIHSKEAEMAERQGEWIRQIKENEAQTTQYFAKEKEIDDAGKSLTLMQEALRKRMDELDFSSSSFKEKEQRLASELSEIGARRQEMECEHQKTLGDLVTFREGLELKEKALEEQRKELERELVRQQDEHRGNTQIKEEIFAALEKLETEKMQWEADKKLLSFKEEEKRKHLENLSEQLVGLEQRLPELENLTENSLARLLAARESLRDHLQEFHQYSQATREEMDKFFVEVSGGEKDIRDLEARVLQAREEHRLAVTSFKQNLVEWQHKVGEIKLSLRTGEENLDRKNAQFITKEKEILLQKEFLEKKEETIRKDQAHVQASQQAVHHHLEDMQEWYRKKIREISQQGFSGFHVHRPEQDQHQSLFVLNSCDPRDRQLGHQLLNLGLIDSSSLDSLLRVSINQRRSFRNLLLNGGFLTFYQMALIEAGNLDSLIIGRFRVIDRLQSNNRENRYLVYDPETQIEGIVRQLAETEMEDSCHPDEYRQQFRTAMTIRNDHVSKTHEVMEIKNLPSIFAEQPIGCYSDDWGFLGRNISAWVQIVWQAIVGLESIHAAGLTFGEIQPESLILEKNGILKWFGVGCPPWIHGNQGLKITSNSDCLRLAQVAMGWIQDENGTTDFAGNIHPEKTGTYLNWLNDSLNNPENFSLTIWKEKTSELIRNLPNLDEEFQEFLNESFNKTTQDKVKRSA